MTASGVRRIQPATTLEPAESATPSSSAAGRGSGHGSQTAACACPAWSSWRGGSGNATSAGDRGHEREPEPRLAAPQRPVAPLDRLAARSPSSSCGRSRRACTKLAAAISPTTTILTASSRP